VAATQASRRSLCYCLCVAWFIDEDPVDVGLLLLTENSVSIFDGVRTPASSAIALMSNQRVGYSLYMGQFSWVRRQGSVIRFWRIRVRAELALVSFCLSGFLFLPTKYQRSEARLESRFFLRTKICSAFS
jgi:hypothetical protein